MKRLLLILLIPILFTGCEKDEKETDLTNEIETAIIGTWQYEEKVIDSIELPAYQKTMLTFNENGIIEVKIILLMTEPYTYEFSEMNLAQR